MRFTLVCVVGSLAPLLAGCGRGAPQVAKTNSRPKSAVAKVAQAEGVAARAEAGTARSVGGPTARPAGERWSKTREFAKDIAEEIVTDQVQNWTAPTPVTAPWPGTFRGRHYPYITNVDPAGYGAAAGVQPGDVLLNYNGVDLAGETSTNNVLYAAINQAAANRQQFAVIVVSRNGQVLEGVVEAGQRV